jgi:uncharacterized protein
MEAAITADRSAESPTTVAVSYVDVHETHTGVVVPVGDSSVQVEKGGGDRLSRFRTHEQGERACLGKSS